MLVLGRKASEKIIIRTPEGREIVIMVTEIGWAKVRLGFVADRDVVIDRDEIHEARKAVVL